MKTIKYVIAICAMSLTCHIQAQVTYQTNDPTVNPVPMGFIGWNDVTNQTLDIRQNNTIRMRFGSTNWPGYNGAAGVNNSSRIYLGVNGNTFANPFSILHMGANINTALSRPWMHVGTTYGAGADIMYTGILQSPGTTNNGNVIDAVIAWGCNDQFWAPNNGPDNLRFLFLAPSNQPISPGSAMEGLEVMRISPNGNAGIGDFSSTGLAQQPTERLDINGNLRIRQIPNNPSNVLITGVQQNAVGDYDLSYIAFPNDASLYLDGTGNWSTLADCRWEDIGTGTGLGSLDIRTGFDLQDPCYRQNVVIGAIGAKSKLAVEARTERDNSPLGVVFDITDSQPGFDAGSNFDVVTALLADASGINENFGTSYVGIQARAVHGRYSVGIDSRADSGVGNSIGVYSVAANAQTTGNPAANIAYYGEVFNPSDVFLYQVGGNTFTTGPTIPLSDQSVKTDINDLQEASTILNQLQPKTYHFVSPENRPIAFSERLQYGLIAQEVLEVLPELVHETTIPELRDSLGAFIEGTSVDLLGVNYDALVPILVAGFNEQSGLVAEQAATIEEQVNQINGLEAQIELLTASLSQLQESVSQLSTAVQKTQQKSDDCCKRISNLTGDASQMNKQSSLEQNVPNPFTESTQIDFNLATSGKVKLAITNDLGQPIATLINGEMSSGKHSVSWDGSAVAPGVYYYSLFFNGDLITKRMIKL